MYLKRESENDGPHFLTYLDEAERPVCESLASDPRWGVFIGETRDLRDGGGFALWATDSKDRSAFWSKYRSGVQRLARLGICSNLTRILRKHRGLFTHKVKAKIKLKF